MPNAVLLCAQEVTLKLSLKQIISQHGLRVVCEQCGEDVINEREVQVDGEILCRACALGAYYLPIIKSDVPASRPRIDNEFVTRIPALRGE